MRLFFHGDPCVGRGVMIVQTCDFYWTHADPGTEALSPEPHAPRRFQPELVSLFVAAGRVELSNLLVILSAFLRNEEKRRRHFLRVVQPKEPVANASETEHERRIRAAGRRSRWPIARRCVSVD